MLRMKKYVGIAKTRPDSFTPRKLPYAITATKKTAIGTSNRTSDGTADARAAVPAATDTATVRM